VGWPISTYETVASLRSAGYTPLADEVSYRWCFMVKRAVSDRGGATPTPKGVTVPIAEKMDVSLCSDGGAATIGHGNQALDDGFRWGCDAFKMLVRELPEELRDALRRDIKPDLLFDSAMKRLPRGRSTSRHALAMSG
jgi:neutral trehalase